MSNADLNTYAHYDHPFHRRRKWFVILFILIVAVSAIMVFVFRQNRERSEQDDLIRKMVGEYHVAVSEMDTEYLKEHCQGDALSHWNAAIKVVDTLREYGYTVESVKKSLEDSSGNVIKKILSGIIDLYGTGFDLAISAGNSRDYRIVQIKRTNLGYISTSYYKKDYKDYIENLKIIKDGAKFYITEIEETKIE